MPTTSIKNSKEPLTSMEHIEELIAQAKKIDAKNIAKEVLTWLNGNVENFIDNTTKYYKIDLFVDNDSLPETRKAQNIYKECGEISDFIISKLIKEYKQEKLEKISECHMILDEVTKEAFKEMRASKEQMERLFKRMSFFYEKIIPNPEAKKRASEIDEELKALINEKERVQATEEKEKIQKEIVKKIDEGVALVKFTELEGAVDITKFEYEAFDVGVQIKKNARSEIVKEYTVPESFIVWLEISHKLKMKRPIAMF